MKIIINKNGNIKSYDGVVQLDNFIISINGIEKEIISKYYLLIYVQANDTKYTLVNCYLLSGNNDVYTFDYESYIDDWQDLENVQIKEIIIEYNEIQYIRRERRTEFHDDGDLICNKRIREEIYRNNYFSVSFVEEPEFKNGFDKYSCDFHNKIDIVYRKFIHFNQLFIELRSIENVFGYAVQHKMLLNKLEIIKDNNSRLIYSHQYV